jgi:hypothetical protein
MGTYSWFITSRNNAIATKIIWTTNTFTHRVLRELFMEAETLEEVGKAFHERKLIGYFTEEVKEDLRTLSASLIPNGCFPRLYYSWEGNDDIMCIEFIPGEPIVNYYVLEDRGFSGTPESSGWIQV